MKFTYLIFMFFCGVAFTLNCSLFTRNGTNIPIKRVDSVKFCDLVNNPDKYDNQSVSTVAVLLTGFERAFLYDPMCISEKTLVWYVIISPSEIEKMNSYLTPESSEFRKKGVIRMKVEISGKFQTRKEKGFGHLNSSNYQFLIEKINSITYVNEDIPYPN